VWRGLSPSERPRGGSWLSAVPLPRTVAEDWANPHCADARSRSAEPIQRASRTPSPRTGPASCIATRCAKACPPASASQAGGPGARRGRSSSMLSPWPCAGARRVTLQVAPPPDGLQTPARVASRKGITMSLRKSIILLTLTAVALTAASPQAATAQQTGPASAPAVSMWPIAPRSSSITGLGRRFTNARWARPPERIGFFANLSLPSSWAAGQQAIQTRGLSPHRSRLS
jgi:hypothetical protein